MNIQVKVSYTVILHSHIKIYQLKCAELDAM